MAHEVSLGWLKEVLGNFSSQPWGHRLKTLSPPTMISRSSGHPLVWVVLSYLCRLLGCSSSLYNECRAGSSPPSLALLAA